MHAARPHNSLVRRYSVVLLSLLAASCGPAGNPQLETEVARLRIEVDELKAKNAESAKQPSRDSAHDERGASARGGASNARQEEMARELRELRFDQERLEEKLAERPAARPSRPQRPRPKPEAVYALDIANAPFQGAKHARVTLVKNFEFA